MEKNGMTSSLGHISSRHRKRLRQRILESQNHRCAYCFTDNKVITLDHVVPVSQGGKASYYNLVAACDPCNQRRGIIDAYEFYDIVQYSLKSTLPNRYSERKIK
jgi:5-methylcytosine-specific restriction endonuclease McrA